MMNRDDTKPHNSASLQDGKKTGVDTQRRKLLARAGKLVYVPPSLTLLSGTSKGDIVPPSPPDAS
jgi:hypothetical protein